MNTQECYIDNKKYTMREFINDSELILKCKKEGIAIFNDRNEEIIFCDGEKVKPYFRKLVNGDSKMTEWHKNWQELFLGYTEQTYKCGDMHKKYRRADVDLDDTHILEFQHSRISRSEVLNRKNDYAKVGKDIIWVIDGNDYDEDDISSIEINILKHSKRIFLEFNDEWKYESFMDYDTIYLDINNMIYEIHPSHVKSNMVDIQFPIDKLEFCNRLKNNMQIFEKDNTTQTLIYVSQQGAGNGKTFRAANLLSENCNNNNTEYHHYDVLVYLTKQHSAKTVIFNEFIDNKDGKHILKSKFLSESFELIKVEKNSKNKKYFIDIKHKRTNKEHKIIIATIDSFVFSLSSGATQGVDKFQSMVNSIIDDGIICSKKGFNRFAGGIRLNKKMLLVGDEMQDLDENYAKAIIKICRDRYVDFYMVGDKLQSIKNERNAFTYVSGTIFPDTIKLIQPTPENKIMRFGSKKLIDFVNDVIPFEKYGLPKIEKHEANNDDGLDSSLVIFGGNTIYASSKENEEINYEVNEIMKYYEDEVKINGCKPNDFLIITPTTKRNPLIEALHTRIREFWKDYYKHDEYKQYSVFHKSEDGNTIDLDESNDATRIVSIHTSKGDGRNVVFVIGMSERSLKLFSGRSDNLVYDSLLHVALTRMKKRLYLRIEKNGDNISKKMYNDGLDQGLYIKYSNHFDIDKHLDNMSRKFYNICWEKIIKHTEYLTFKNTHKEDDNPENKKEQTKELVDIKHHCIRAASMRVSFMICIANDKFGKNKTFGEQFWHILKACKDFTIATKTDAKAYNRSLYDKDNQEIPILKYNNREYKFIYDELMNHITIVRKQLASLIREDNKKGTLLDLKVMDSLVLLHLMEISQKTYMSMLPITDMYDIINLYIKSNPDEKECYLQNHYDRLNKMGEMYKLITSRYKGLKWKWGRGTNSFYQGKDGSKVVIPTLKNELNALNDDTLLLIKYCPQFNHLNYNKIIFDSIFSLFLFKNSDNKHLDHDNPKKIIVCVLSLDLNEPYYIDFEELIDNNKTMLVCILKDSISEYFSDKNKEVYFMFHQYMKKCGENTYDYINKIDELIKKCKNQKIELPSFVTETFGYIKKKIYKYGKKGKYEKLQKFITKINDEEKFLSEINDQMNDELNAFFGITDKDTFDFRQEVERLKDIKISDEAYMKRDNINTLMHNGNIAPNKSDIVDITFCSENKKTNHGNNSDDNDDVHHDDIPIIKNNLFTKPIFNKIVKDRKNITNMKDMCNNNDSSSDMRDDNHKFIINRAIFAKITNKNDRKINIQQSRQVQKCNSITTKEMSKSNPKTTITKTSKLAPTKGRKNTEDNINAINNDDISIIAKRTKSQPIKKSQTMSTKAKD